VHDLRGRADGRLAGRHYKGDFTKLGRRARTTILWNARLKAEVLAGYGGRCACCGEAETSMLQLDHVHGRGNQERATHRSNWKGVYIRARREGFPADLQLLVPAATCPRPSSAAGAPIRATRPTRWSDHRYNHPRGNP
jgi:hypothetical protein